MQNRWLVELLVSWLPFIVLIGVWVLLSRRWSSGGVAKMAQLYEQQIAETKRMNVYLERIAISMEKRSAE
jgi:ATP-dependent Zn protease